MEHVNTCLIIAHFSLLYGRRCIFTPLVRWQWGDLNGIWHEAGGCETIYTQGLIATNSWREHAAAHRISELDHHLLPFFLVSVSELPIANPSPPYERDDQTLT